jgi:hypothetical protein
VAKRELNLEHPFFPPSVFAWDGMIDSLEVQVLYPARWRRRGTPSVQLQRR